MCEVETCMDVLSVCVFVWFSRVCVFALCLHVRVVEACLRVRSVSVCACGRVVYACSLDVCMYVCEACLRVRSVCACGQGVYACSLCVCTCTWSERVCVFPLYACANMCGRSVYACEVCMWVCSVYVCVRFACELALCDGRQVCTGVAAQVACVPDSLLTPPHTPSKPCRISEGLSLYLNSLLSQSCISIF